MKLRNKKTGETVDFKIIADYDDCTSGWRLEKHDGSVLFYDHIDEIHEEWEDAPEEPKDYWFIDPEILIACESTNPLLCDKKVAIETMKQIGNYFETREEAEKAVEKLKAWKRLKDKEFSIYSWDYEFDMVDKPSQTIILRASAVDSSNTDLDLLFGGEE